MATMNHTVSFDRACGKYVAMCDGKVVTKTKSMNRAKRLLRMHLQGLREVAKAEVDAGLNFSVSDRFTFLEALTTMVANGTSPSAIVTGEGGIGKTHTVTKTLASMGFVNCMEIPEGMSVPTRKTYTMVKGYSTPYALYRTLCENADRIVVFDDCDSILKDPTAINLLKAALDSYSKRIVCWQSEVKGSDLPSSFVFNGGVIFISNHTLGTLDQAVRTRALCVDLSMTADQKLERMEQILRELDYRTDVSLSMKLEALGAIRENLSKVKNLSLRTLKQVIDVRKGNRKDWSKLALYVMSQ